MHGTAPSHSAYRTLWAPRVACTLDERIAKLRSGVPALGMPQLSPLGCYHMPSVLVWAQVPANSALYERNDTCLGPEIIMHLRVTSGRPRKENDQMCRAEGYYRRPYNKRNAGTPRTSNYWTPRSTPRVIRRLACLTKMPQNATARLSRPSCVRGATAKQPQRQIEACSFSNINCFSTPDQKI